MARGQYESTKMGDNKQQSSGKQWLVIEGQGAQGVEPKPNDGHFADYCWLSMILIFDIDHY